MKLKVYLEYFIHGYQILKGAIFEFPFKLYLHSLIFVLLLTSSMRMLVQHSKILSGFEQFCATDSLQTSIFH